MTEHRQRPPAAAEITEELRWREDVQEAAREWGVDAEQVKPCAARLFWHAERDRNDSAYMLGTEWRRMGLAEPVAWALAERWNADSRRGLPASELRRALKSAYAGGKNFGCNGRLAQWCIGKTRCTYHAQFISGPRRIKGKTEMKDFKSLGWRPPHATLGECAVYEAIIDLEQLRQVGAGGRVIASLRQIAQQAGLSVSGVRKMLAGLHGKGLIEYLPGQPRAKGLPPRGCTLRRVIPIPDLPLHGRRGRRAPHQGARSSENLVQAVPPSHPEEPSIRAPSAHR